MERHKVKSLSAAGGKNPFHPFHPFSIMSLWLNKDEGKNGLNGFFFYKNHV